MPLNYDYGTIKKSTKVWEPDGTFDDKGVEMGYMTEVLNTLIWATSSVGLSEITEKNWKDFYTRMKIIGKDRSLLRRDKKGSYTVPISAQEVKDHIGLVTNATSLTKAEFLKRAYRIVHQDIRDNLIK
jgi:hypothetical protein